MATSSELEQARKRSFDTWEAMAPGWSHYSDDIWRDSRHVGEWLVAHVDPQPGETVLELAAGPGDTGFVAAKLIGDEGRLISTDFSPRMVEAARQRARSLGIDNADFEVVDAEKMDLDDASVDIVIARWGFMLMIDPQAALGETARVLRPGGRLSFSVWAGPEKNPWITMTGMTLVQLGHQLPGDPFAPGGMFSMSDPDQVVKMLGSAGLTDPTIEDVPVTWTFDDFDNFWEFLTRIAGPMANLIKSLDEGQVKELQQALLEGLEPFKADSGYGISGVTICAAARRPELGSTGRFSESSAMSDARGLDS